MISMPTLETGRVVIRPFTMDDLDAIHRIFDVELQEAFGTDAAQALAERTDWLRWTVLSYEQLAMLNQPPYGDRAVVLKQIGQVIGAVGLVPCLNFFEQLPAFSPAPTRPDCCPATAEVGLFYAISPAFQGQGYATEAAQALVDYGFQHLRLKRMVATTTYDNAGSIGVMRKLGMQIETNPHPEPPWLQVVGVVTNERLHS